MPMIRKGARDARAAPGRGRWLGAGAASLVVHLSILAALLSGRTQLPRPPLPQPMAVELVAEPAPIAAPAPTPAAPVPARRPPPRMIVRPTPAIRTTDTLAAVAAPTAASGVGLSDAELAGAVAADSGLAGGVCDMARRVQRALRKDALVQAAVAQAHNAEGWNGRAIVVWNGDWIQSQGEDGKGLAAVREAIMWEVAFAPPACRAEAVRGPILISLAPGSARLAVGSGQWRWSDLLRTSER
jgi:hypothetical protein